MIRRLWDSFEQQKENINEIPREIAYVSISPVVVVSLIILVELISFLDRGER